MAKKATDVTSCTNLHADALSHLITVTYEHALHHLGEL